jgi:uncharacterized alkaline shock family protein YloU
MIVQESRDLLSGGIMSESKPTGKEQPDKSKRKSRALKPPKNEPVTTLSEYVSGPGITTVAPEVVITIARLTALDSDGVSRMSSVPGAVSRLKKGATEGVHLEFREDTVFADLYIVVKNNVNLREVSRNVQSSVSRAISEMVGMQVGRVNIHIEDIDFPEKQEVH